MADRRLSGRAAELEEPPTRGTTEIVERLRDAGRAPLSLNGSPFWLPPEHVLEAGRRAVSDLAGAPLEGLLSLRTAFAARLEHVNGVTVDPGDELLVTNAANHALYVIFTALLDPGDEVLLFSPHYYYEGIIALAGGRLVYVPTSQEQSWRWDLDRLAAAVTPRTKVLLINTPVNPVGHVATEAELTAVAALAERHDLLIVADEAFEHLVYDGRAHLSIASLPEMHARTVTAYSFTKSYAMRHWRLGLLAAPRPLMRAFRNVFEWNVFTCNHVAQHAAQAALVGAQDWVRDIGIRFQRCRDVMVAGLRDVPGLSFTVPQANPFLFLDTTGLGVSSDEFRRTLMFDYGVPVDPGRQFGSSTHLRLPFGGELSDVEEAALRVRSAVTTAMARVETTPFRG